MLESSQIDLLEAFELYTSHDDEKKRIISYFLHEPWKCPDDLVKRYVDPNLTQVILKFKKSVLDYIFNEPINSNLFVSVKTLNIDSILKYKEKFTFYSELDFALLEKTLFIELISEDLLKNTDRSWSTLNEHEKDSLLGLYIYCAIAAYYIVGVVKKEPNKNIFKICSKWHIALNTKNLRSISNFHSSSSDRILAFKIFPFLQNLKKQSKPIKNSDELMELTLKLIDKIFSIHADYIQDRQRIKQMGELVDLMQLLIFLWAYALMKAHKEKKECTDIHDTTPIAKHEIINAGFTEYEIDSLINTSEAPSSERLIEKENDSQIYNIRYLNIKYVAQIYAKKIQESILQNKWFEQDYIIPYLKKRLATNRFIIGKGFTNKDNSIIPKYDVDVVIYDEVTKLFYFCQIKHRLYSLCIGLRGELREYKSFIRGGISQLKDLRSNINHKKVKAQLKTAFQGTRVNSKFINNNDFTTNSRFLLIHNVENFDYCSKDEITMYEWNSFRNLLQGRFWQVSMEHIFQKEYTSNHIDFSSLTDVKEIFLKENLKLNIPKEERNNSIANAIETGELVKYLYMRNIYKIQLFGKNIPFYRKKEDIEIPVI